MLLAPNFAQQHATQLLPPVQVLGVVLLNQAIVVALALFVGRAVQLLLRRSIAQNAAFLVDDIVAVRLDGEDGPEARHRLRHGVGCSARAVWGSGRCVSVVENVVVWPGRVCLIDHASLGLCGLSGNAI